MKIKSYLAIVACAAVSLSFTSCDKDEEGARTALEPTPIVLPEGTRAITESGNDFSFRLFREIASSTDDNTAISPLNVMNTLAMLANGDNGESRDEILRVLGRGTGESELRGLTAYCNALLTQLPEADRTTELRFANSFWYSPGIILNGAFTDILSEQFSADLINKSVGGTEGMGLVNEWVRSKTRGLIDELLTKPLNENTRSALLDAVYFKGMWKDKFDKSLTSDAIFHNSDGSETEARFMFREGEYLYTALDNMRAIRLPYGNGNFRMTVILPEGENSIEDLVSTLGAETLADLDREAHFVKAKLYLPKFECGYNEDVQDYLKNLGVGRLFDSGLNSVYPPVIEPFVAGLFRHAVTVRVDEEGSEAAAATLVPDAIIGVVYPVGEMRVDRPFIFMISETTTGAILFIGQITHL